MAEMKFLRRDQIIDHAIRPGSDSNHEKNQNVLEKNKTINFKRTRKQDRRIKFFCMKPLRGEVGETREKN